MRLPFCRVFSSLPLAPMRLFFAVFFIPLAYPFAARRPHVNGTKKKLAARTEGEAVNENDRGPGWDPRGTLVGRSGAPVESGKIWVNWKNGLERHRFVGITSLLFFDGFGLLLGFHIFDITSSSMLFAPFCHRFRHRYWNNCLYVVAEFPTRALTLQSPQIC